MPTPTDWSMQGILCEDNQDCSRAGEQGLVCCGPPNVPMAPRYCDTPSRCSAVGFQYTPLEPHPTSPNGGTARQAMNPALKIGIVAAVVVGAYMLATKT